LLAGENARFDVLLAGKAARFDEPGFRVSGIVRESEAQFGSNRA
jgi:hypothetical protein